jgi:hypothetical protein
MTIPPEGSDSQIKNLPSKGRRVSEARKVIGFGDFEFVHGLMRSLLSCLQQSPVFWLADANPDFVPQVITA